MLRKLLSTLSICALLMTAAACGSDDPYTGPEPQGKTDPAKPEEPEKPDEPEEQGEPLSMDFLTAKETIKAMGAGWNLGNTLDANSGDTLNMWIEAWGPSDVVAYEKAWGQVPPTKELFKMLHDKGFRTIRVPVTWWPHLGTKFEFGSHPPIWYKSESSYGYTVEKAWMDEVKRVVDCVLEADMYCILNVHHDTGTANTHWVIASMDSYAENSDRFKGLWSQIAETFKGYDGRLMFEAYNEMTDALDSWCFASYAAPGNYNADIARSAYDAVNAYAQDFVDVVRTSGGNNANRNLIVNTYAACCGDGNWNAHLKDPLKEMKLPDDTVKDHLMFQVHYYPSFKNITEGKKSVDDVIKGLNEHLVPKGAPVVFGEWGSFGDVNYDQYRSSYLEFAKYFVQKAKANGMATIYWMGITDCQDRAVPKFTQEDLADAIIEGIR